MGTKKEKTYTVIAGTLMALGLYTLIKLVIGVF